MSTIEGLERMGLSEFNGSKPLIDASDLAPSDAQVALNCRFSPGLVQTREGFAVYAEDAANNNILNSMSYFSKGATGSPVEYLALLRWDLTNDIIQVKNLSSLAVTSILTLTHPATTEPSFAIFAPAGDHLYANLVQSPSNGNPPTTGLPYVWDGNTSNQMIACFQRPMKTTEVTEALTQPGAGVVSAGTHYVGVLFQTKSGYWTKPGPADATTLALVPQSIVSTGTNNIRVTLTPATTWPAWIQAVQVIMTTAQNSFEYYVIPGTITSVTAGGAGVVTIDVNIADEHLTSTGSQGAGTLATDYFGLLSMNASNAQPFNVRACLPWGQRMVWFVNYGGVDCFFPSDPLNPEWISADQHIVQMPGGKPFGSAFVLRGVLYVVSSAGGVYAYVDNGGRPVSFSPPTEVDGAISCPSFYCTTTSSTGGYALIASTQGIYQFSGGSLPQLPLSYYQTPDIEAIQWSNADLNYGFQIKDFPEERTVFFFANTGGSGLGTLFTWCYSRGMKPDQIQYSKWTSPAGTFIANGPPIEIVRNGGHWQLFLIENYSPHAAIMRLKSAKAGDSLATLYTDFLGASFTAAGINWQYQTAPLPKLDDSPMLQHLALRVRAKSLTGTPSIYFSAKSLDNARTITMPLSPLALSTAPGREWTAFYDSQEERVSYLFTNNTVAGAGIAIARLTHFYNFFAEQR